MEKWERRAAQRKKETPAFPTVTAGLEKRGLRWTLTALGALCSVLLFPLLELGVSREQGLLCQGLLFLAQLGMIWFGPMSVNRICPALTFYGSAVWGVCTGGMVATVWTISRELAILTPYLALLLAAELLLGVAGNWVICGALRLLERQTLEEEREDPPS